VADRCHTAPTTAVFLNPVATIVDRCVGRPEPPICFPPVVSLRCRTDATPVTFFRSVDVEAFRCWVVVGPLAPRCTPVEVRVECCWTVPGSTAFFRPVETTVDRCCVTLVDCAPRTSTDVVAERWTDAPAPTPVFASVDDVADRCSARPPKVIARDPTTCDRW
jgi:hypothetical protein